MDDALAKKLIRQLKWLNFWVTFFGVLFIASFVIAGILLFKAVTYIHHADQSIQSVQTKASQTLNVPSDICNGSAASVIKQYTSACQ